MKRLVLSAAIILLFTVLCTVHVRHLASLTHTLIDQLEHVRTSVENGNWSTAKKHLSSAAEEWERQAFYLHTTLRHTDIDAILGSLNELDAYLSSREDRAESLAVIARTINQLELLLEAEQPNVKNLF